MNDALLAAGVRALAFLPPLLAALALDRYRREPAPRLLACALWGLVLGVLARVVPDHGLWPAASLPVLAGLIALAEVLKTVPVGVLAAGRHLAGPLDGVAYGIAAGLGFAAPVAVGSAGLDPLLGALALGLVSTCASALFGGVLGRARLSTGPGRIGLVAGALAAATALHVAGVLAWRPLAGSPHAAAWLAGLAALVVGLLVAGLALAARQERRILERTLGDEVRLGVLPGWVVEVVPRWNRRVRRGWWKDPDERRAVARLLVEIGFRKQQLTGMRPERARIFSLRLGRLRDRARAVFAPHQPGDDGA